MYPTNLTTSLSLLDARDVVACIRPKQNFDVLAWAYADAAKMLSNHIEEDGFYTDIAVYPICFLYRHSLELRLKQIVWDGRRLLGEKSRIEQICKSHKLLPLWQEADKIMKKVWANAAIPNEIEILHEVITWFEKCDPSSQGFRYPFTAKLEPMLAEQNHINLTHLSKTMEVIGSFLSGASGAIGDYLSDLQNSW